MKEIKFLSIDPSLRNTGFVVGYIDCNGQIEPKNWVLCETEKDDNSVADNTVNSCFQIFGYLENIIKITSPDIIFAEVPSGSKSASAMKGYGISCAIIAFAKTYEDIELVIVTPRQAKVLSVGDPSASKGDIQNWTEEFWPDFPFERKKDGSLVKTRMEHVCDAIAIAHSGIQLYLQSTK